jgi:hypothetical protein
MVFKKIKSLFKETVSGVPHTAIDRKLEEALYEFVVTEIESGVRRRGLWGKALANAQGDETKAKGLYIQYRVESLEDDQKIIASLGSSATAPAPASSRRSTSSTKSYSSRLPTPSGLSNERRLRTRKMEYTPSKGKKPETSGSFVFKDGSKYTGKWLKGKPHGKGELIKAGVIYTGDFEDGKPHGRVEEDTGKGTYYKGAFKNGKRHGRGVFTMLNGKSYGSTWKNGKQ